ncbi:hypothetical protein FRC07_004907 [Ceratobasidium sp. 392]|nr:hypothetical protein FRC07_004907 [Ceratobasidium sp. 392]
MAPAINSLPPEILTRIFSESICFCNPRLQLDSKTPILNPITFSSVCQHWRQVAVNHRSLWTHIDLEVNIMDSNGRYHSPDVWIERSKGAPLYVHVYQPGDLSDDDYEEEMNEESLTALPGSLVRPPAAMLSRLVAFLSPLMPQTCSVTVSLPYPYQSTLNLLMTCWKAHGASGVAKVLKVHADSELAELMVPWSVSFKTFFESLEVLHLHNTFIAWSRFALNNLTALEIKMGEGHWAMNPSGLAAILASCPKLQHLGLEYLSIGDISEPKPNRAFLGELRTLEIGTFAPGSANGTAMLEAALAIIDAGQHALSMKIASYYYNEPIQNTLNVIRSFANRSNVTTLRMYGHNQSRHTGDPLFASQLGPLLRVQTLVLDYWYFCDSMEVEQMIGDPDVYQNPCPINPEQVLWLQLQNLYLNECILEKDHLRELVSLHSIQSLFMRNCYDGWESRSPIKPKSQVSNEYVQLLSAVVPKVVHSSDAWGVWLSSVD